MKTSFTNQFKWVVFFRLITVSVIGGLAIFFRKKALDFSVGPLWIIIGLSYLLTFLHWIFLKKEKSAPFILWSSVIMDVFIVTAMIHYTGGIESGFTFLYSLPIIAASMFFFLKGGTVIATLCSAAYGGLLLMEFNRALNSVLLSSLTHDPDALYLDFYVKTIFFYLLAATSGYLGERFRQKSEALEQVKLDTDTILHSIYSGLIAIDYEGNLLYKNSKVDKIIGFTIKKNIKEITELKDWSHKILTGEISRGFQEITLNFKILGINIYPLQTTGGRKRGILLIIQDITETKLTEELATIGRFSANLAHEVRNPISAILGPCELLKEDKLNEQEKQKLVTIISEQSQRLNDIVTNFLAFAKPINVTYKLSEIGSLIKETIRLIGFSSIELKQKKEIWVTIDPEQMKIVFSNLILNAIDAINSNDKPTQKIEIEVLSSGDAYSLFGEQKVVSKEEVVINFRDNGIGLPEDQLKRIFTPFYTTKPAGVGLGLSIVSRIIENHKGKIELKSKLNEGTVFSVTLPLPSA